jgi:hypothetical protein
VCLGVGYIWQRRESFFLKRLVTRRNSNFLDKNRKFLKEHLKKGFLFSSKRIHFCENCVTHPTPSILYIRYTKRHLKVPKREIFDRSDFPDFYTIKSLCVGDFGVKIKKMLNNN